MDISVVTLFPKLVNAYVSEGVIGRGIERGLATVTSVDIRDFTDDAYRTVDDVPFGGGAGMVLKPEPVARAIESVGDVEHRVLLTPSGRPFEQSDALKWAQMKSLVLVCGRYEGIDERICDEHIDEAVSIGDYVLSGGELAALVVLDCTLRLIPGVLGNTQSVMHESFSDGLLEHPHFTRPSVWRDKSVPDVLLSGHHARIDSWRRRASLERTLAVRPDLLHSAELTPTEKDYVLERNSSNDREEG
jgi:tRNA (guanine37-N1)-methyltransferase